MLVQVNTDNHIEGKQQLQAHVEAVILDAVAHHAEQVTHVVAHLGDVNSTAKSGADDLRCLLEVRLAGHKPMAVSHSAESLHQAIDGAADKLQAALDTQLGKQLESGHPRHLDVRDDDVWAECVHRQSRSMRILRAYSSLFVVVAPPSP